MNRTTETPAPDASMGLLREAVERAVDPGYALAAARRTPAPGRERHPRSAAAAGALAVLLGLGTTTAVITLRQPAPPGARQALLDEIDARAAVADAAGERAAALRADIDARATPPGADPDVALATATATASRLAGTTQATGPGLRLVIDDAVGARTPGALGADPRSASDTAQGVVLDRDLQVVVNGLLAAGASAVAVDDHRLTSLTSVRVAGQAILVDYQPLSPPYRVEAVGDPAAMAAAFAASPAGDYLAALTRAYGVRVTSTAQPSLSLPPGAAPTLRHATAAPSPPDAPATDEAGGRG